MTWNKWKKLILLTDNRNNLFNKKQYNRAVYAEKAQM